ncbi:MAG: hypothetical protein NZT61_00760 [Deltaproteobacteria bacterium]|nr:hypothetical protein [Deltaproteobacteria bacterium]
MKGVIRPLFEKIKLRLKLWTKTVFCLTNYLQNTVHSALFGQLPLITSVRIDRTGGSCETETLKKPLPPAGICTKEDPTCDPLPMGFHNMNFLTDPIEQEEFVSVSI